MADMSQRRSSGSYNRKSIPNYKRSAYVDGSTVRKLSAVPEREREHTPKRAPKRYPHRKPVHMAGIDGKSFAFLMGAAIVMLGFTFVYLYTQSDVRSMKNDISVLQREIEEKQEENEAKYDDILASVDLSEVYKKATKELGMVRAQNNKIYTYKNKKSDLVKQYADIPGSDD